MGLCGLTAGAVRVYFRSADLDVERLPSELSRAALAFALAIPVGYVLVLFLVFSAVLALPFYPAGVAIAAALTRTELPVGRVYAVDLAGAALGAPLVPLLLSVTDGGTAILLLSVVAAAGAWAFAAAGDDTKAKRRALTAAAALALVSVANGTTDHGLRPLWVKERPELYAQVEKELWNSH